MTETPAIAVQGLHKKYRDGYLVRKDFHALRGIDLTVPSGEVFGLLGPNGAGKTTLIKILLGIVRRSQGSAKLLGFEAGSKDARRHIGYLPENMAFPSYHNAIQSLRLYGRLSGVPEDAIRRRSAQLLEQVGLAGREKELVRKYSKGMRQRLGLAQAMLHEPELLILDEPTDGLDPVGRSQIRQLIVWLKEQGKTVFLNSHILQEVELVCDRVAILAGGQVKGVGTPAELTSQFHGAFASRLRLELSLPHGYATTDLANLLGVQPQEVLPLPDNRLECCLNVESQADVDRHVDHLRAANVSVRKLERTRLTLEEVFLSAVNDSANSPPLHAETAAAQ